MKQEYKITYGNNSTVFFFAHSLKSAKEHSEDFYNRNTEELDIKMYVLSSKPRPFPRWEFVK